ncbi:DUF4184 family protein [Acinetobacter sp. DSM 11652]|uniref:DUF4184 family protein n=1 Tax=Acinetobacter sp. DSM 11652 TaxID=346222 RepID=UPI0008C04E98|nr:DUF4184 family protein [Acinetobacter sp. DSM 11652]SEM01821.1 protein of unknown function [Acinetobacter sp. DSM 11652]
MPFTISHAVLAPILHKASEGTLPISALAIGCMVPDLFRLFTDEHIQISHQWSALLYPNLLMGMAFCLLWYALLRPTFFRWVGIYNPLKLLNFRSVLQFFLLINISLILGISSHILWDGLTHVDYRTFAFHDLLAKQINLFGQHYPLHRILQVGTSIIVLPFILWFAKQYFCTYRQPFRVTRSITIFAVVSVLISILGGLFGFIHFNSNYNTAILNDLYGYIGFSINYFFRGFLLTFAICALVFQILDQLELFEGSS